MPAADTILELYKFELHTEQYIRSALVTAGLPDGSVKIAQGSDLIDTPCTTVLLQTQSVNGHKASVDGRTYPVFDQWGVVIQTAIRTNRSLNQLQHDLHRATCRMVFADAFTTINTLLPYHAFANVPAEQGTQLSVDEENRHDISIITFQAVLAIKSDAWPTT